MKWQAYCKDCNTELIEANNGQMVEAAAEIHRDETGHDSIIIGYYLPEAGPLSEEILLRRAEENRATLINL